MAPYSDLFFKGYESIPQGSPHGTTRVFDPVVGNRNNVLANTRTTVVAAHATAHTRDEGACVCVCEREWEAARE